MTAMFATTDLEQAAAALRNLHVETLLLPVLCQLAVILCTARLFNLMFRRIGQPGVVGEIAAGIVLGPSVFGLFFPSAFQALFAPAVQGVEPALFHATINWVFQAFSQLGLVFVLFLMGLEFDFSHLRWNSRSAAMVSTSGVVVPFALGMVVAWLVHPAIEPHPDVPGQPVNRLGFALFLGTALAITAIPVLGRIMVELGIQRTRIGAIVIASAAINDAAGWIMLAAITAVVRGAFDASETLRMILYTLLFSGGMMVVARPLLVRWARRAIDRGDGDLPLNHLAVLLVLVLISAIATNLIGIFAIFGAFLLGAVLSGEHAFREAVVQRLRDFVEVFFLPIFFAYTGLNTDIGSIDSLQLWLIAALVLAAAIVGKVLGCGVAAHLVGFKPREAACIGVMMNTRGLVELVVVNIGYRLQVIPDSVYCMLVLMALITTFMTTPLLARLSRGTELDIQAQPVGARRKG